MDMAVTDAVDMVTEALDMGEEDVVTDMVEVDMVERDTVVEKVDMVDVVGDMDTVDMGKVVTAEVAMEVGEDTDMEEGITKERKNKKP